MVDEAHGIGVFGKGGRGTCDHFGVTKDVDLIMGTFSKSFASLGGFIATDKEITNFLRHHSRSYIFTASITPASTAAALKAIDIMEQEPERQEHLWEITKFALDGFRNMGCEIGNTSTPIIPPLFVRDDYKTYHVVRDLFDEGLFVNPVVSPRSSPAGHSHPLLSDGNPHQGTGGICPDKNPAGVPQIRPYSLSDSNSGNHIKSPRCAESFCTPW